MVRNHRSAPVLGAHRAAAAIAALALLTTGLTALPRLIPSAHAATTFTVNSSLDTADANAGNGVCETAVAGQCTLRAAIEESNAGPGGNTVQFSVTSVTLATNLSIAKTVTIDGTNGAGCAAAAALPKVSIQPGGLFILATAPGTVIKGLNLQGYSTITANASGNLIQCNFIGTTATATDTGPITNTGVRVAGPANVIGGPLQSDGNVIAVDYENLAQVYLRPGSDGSKVLNNWFGITPGGVAIIRHPVGLQNGWQGVIAESGGNQIQFNRFHRQAGAVALFSAGNGVTNNTITDSASGISVAGCPVSNVCGPTGIQGFGNTLRANTVAQVGPYPFSDATYRFLGIDLESPFDTALNYDPNIGVTLNHAGDVTSAFTPNHFQNYPVLDTVTSNGTTTHLGGRLNGSAGVTYGIDVFANNNCSPLGFGDGEIYLGAFNVTADGNGLATINQDIAGGLGEPYGVTTTATNLTTGDTSEFSYCRAASTPNVSWFAAQPVGTSSSTSQRITERLQEKWFKVPVSPGAKVTVKLTGQPGSSLSLHRDPNPFYSAANNPSSAAVLSAEAADSGFLPSGFLPSGFLPSGFLPSGFLPSGFLPSGFLPSGFLPSGFLPSGFLPSGFLPSGFLPSSSLPSGFLPSSSLPSGFLPSGFLPSGFLPSGSLPSGFLPSAAVPAGALPGGNAAYETAARKSLMGISMDPSSTVQTIERNTFDISENLYVRVVGPYDLAHPFTLDVTVTGGVCQSLSLAVGGALAPAPGTNRDTLILTDSGRIGGTPAEVSTALAKLTTLAQRGDVNGVVVDLNSGYPRVAAAKAQADANLACPQAKNVLAGEIKAVVDSYRASNPLKYVVLAGGASAIPFYQSQDVAGLASEKDYVPPVAANTAADSALRSGLVSGQDYYGSSTTLNVGGRSLALPDLAVGRLVDSANDISAAVDAYTATNGVVTPASSLVTGYDFVGDAANAVAAEMATATNAAPDTLIQNPGLAPTDPTAWKAADLRTKLLGTRHDVVMLTGHFSAGNLLAADYTSSVSAAEVRSSSADLARSIVIALGCHSGYSVPTADALAGASPDPDWAKAFLRKGSAGFIAATGYAYGDTELTEYGERLVVALAKQLRTGNGPIALGQALVQSKRAYLAATAQVTGIDEKTLTEMTLYGLPMMKVNLPGARLPVPGGGAAVTPTAVTTGPGAAVGLTSASQTVTPTLTAHPVTLPVITSSGSQTGTVTATYYEGRDGVVANPSEPILPKQIDNVTAGSGVLRGVALRGGDYNDIAGITALTSSPNTETSGPHPSFNSDVFYPTQPWTTNFFDAVSGGLTRLVTVPAQYRSTSPGSSTGTLRTFSNLNLKLYYLPASWPAAGGTTKAAAISPGPNVFGASATVNGQVVTFNVNAQNDGAAGVQEVWVLYTGGSYAGHWLPLDLVRDAIDPNVWSASLTVTGDPSQLRFIVQAVNAAGLTSLSTNLGAYYAPPAAGTPATPAASSIAFTANPGSLNYLGSGSFSATVNPPAPNRTVVFDIAGQQAIAATNGSGVATVNVTPSNAPGSYSIQAAVRGDAFYTAASQTGALSIVPDGTSVTISRLAGYAAATPINSGDETGVIATLRDSSGRAFGGKSVVFAIRDAGGVVRLNKSVSTDTWGVAALGAIVVPGGNYTVEAYFSGSAPTVGGGTLTSSDPTYTPSQATGTALVIRELAGLTITANATNADNTPYTAGTWTKQNVTVRFTCTDGVAVATCPANITVTTEGVTASVSGTATNTRGATATATFGPIQIDRTPPTITLTTPANAASYAQGATVNAAYSCADTTGASGITTCSGTVANGAPIATSTPGTQPFNVTATDAAGNTATTSVTFTVTGAPTLSVKADMTVAGLEDVAFPTNAILLVGTYTDPTGNQGPYTASARWRTGATFSPFALSAFGEFAAANIYSAGGTYTVTVKICNRNGVCGTDDVTVRSNVTPLAKPVLECVTDRGATANPRYVARFGYNNPGTAPIVLATLPLIDNTFTVLPALRGQPQVFLTGSPRNVFTVGFASGSIAWKLNGTTVTASSTTTRC